MRAVDLSAVMTLRNEGDFSWKIKCGSGAKKAELLAPKEGGFLIINLDF